MSNWKRRLYRLFSGKPSSADEQPNVEELRELFQRRYRSFLSLLTSNAKALDIMTEIQLTLEGARPFGMSFVRSRTTAASVNAWKTVKYLNELAPGKYEPLFERHRLIEGQLEALLSPDALMLDGPLVLPFSAVNHSVLDLVGEKTASLGTIRNDLGLNVPDGFVITSAAYYRFMSSDDLGGEIRRRMQAYGPDESGDRSKLCTHLQQLIVNRTIPDDLQAAIDNAYADLTERCGFAPHVSVRSSATGEDVLGRAFAGQFHSELNVRPENIGHAYKQVIASQYGLTAASYRLNRGIPDESTAMCVGVMIMIDSVAGGVIYSRDPFHPHESRSTVYSVWGLPKGVVGGSVPTDSFIVDNTEPYAVQSRSVRHKPEQFVCHPGEGAHRVQTGNDRAGKASLTDDQARELTRIAARLEAAFGSPQDIEWCLDRVGVFYILQSRALEMMTGGSVRPGKLTEDPEGLEILAIGEITASRGVGVGPVFTARNEADKLRFPSGAVLVVATASPGWAPLLAQAAAVVAEQGSMAGHLANVAREFGVPALFGIAGASEVFKDGQQITVDADTGTIVKGRAENLLRRRSSRKNLMEGSPVLRTLEAAAAHICPLNLIDPDSPDFRQAKCRTFHDITRFAHEMSVREMFNFGSEHDYPARAAKKLKCTVPMQWLIIDLDDGIKQPCQEDVVSIDMIASEPMQALWKGITAMPWAGPPRVEARGFMSVLVQSTMNPDIDAAVPSTFSTRNYFMISKSFCSFFSRLGYHLSTVEALVSERIAENYVGFSFKGGAADEHRRTVRARLIGDILQENGFRVTVEKDRVTARVNHQDAAYMKQCLVILGYLIMHTRQCDMAMGSQEAVGEYRRKFTADIELLKKDSE